MAGVLIAQAFLPEAIIAQVCTAQNGEFSRKSHNSGLIGGKSTARFSREAPMPGAGGR